jgi:hypothetical protein
MMGMRNRPNSPWAVRRSLFLAWSFIVLALSATGCRAFGQASRLSAVPSPVPYASPTPFPTGTTAVAGTPGVPESGSVAAGEDAGVPALIKTLLESEDPRERQEAAFRLGGIGPQEGVVPALIQAMEEDPNMRWVVAEALWKIGPPAAEAVPALIQALEDECAAESEQACDVEREAIVRALRGITGQGFGDDAAAWRKWWEEQR